MAVELHYSPAKLLRRSGMIALIAAVVFVDYVLHAHGGVPRVFGLDLVPSMMLFALGLYGVVATMVLTIALIRHGGVALATSPEGLTLRSAWFCKSLQWGDISRVSLDVRYGKSSSYTVVVVHEAAGLLPCHSVDTRLLSEPLDRVSEWIDAAERQRVARGGIPYQPPTAGLAGYAARLRDSRIAAERKAATRT